MRGEKQMKSTGIVRNVDDLGRIVIPKELRRVLGIEERDPVEIFIDGEQVILRKYKPNMACAITGEVSDQNIRLFDGKLVVSEDGAQQLLAALSNINKK